MSQYSTAPEPITALAHRLRGIKVYGQGWTRKLVKYLGRLNGKPRPRYGARKTRSRVRVRFRCRSRYEIRARKSRQAMIETTRRVVDGIKATTRGSDQDGFLDRVNEMRLKTK